MMAPWTNKTGLAKAAAILATIALVSLGLCGVNFVGAISFYGAGSGRLSANVVDSVLFVGAWVEIAGIVVGVAGLIVVGIIALSRAATRNSRMQTETDARNEGKEE